MRFGYSFWGFVGDNKIENGKEVSTPDGNATYSWSIVHEAQKRGWKVYSMQQDRDFEAVSEFGLENNFSTFNCKKRAKAWADTLPTFGIDLPELDVLLLEWRWQIPGRNCFLNEQSVVSFIGEFGEKAQPDFMRQMQLLNHYKGRNTKIIIFDLDHKLTADDERHWQPDAIFETSVTPLHLTMDRTRVEIPTVVSDLLEFPTIAAKENKKLIYVGSRYERDDIIEKFIKPVSDRFPNEVQFYGNWTNEPNLSECKKMWPNILYNGRITVKGFRDAYSDAIACPLLCKQSYMDSGFITARIWESILFGTIPIGLSATKGIQEYVSILAVKDSQMMIDLIKLMPRDVECRDRLRRELIEKIWFMDVRHFVDKIENVVS